MSDIRHPGFSFNPRYVPDVKGEVREWVETGEIICNEAAREIAGWWSAPSGHGYAFAVFATSGKVTHGLMAAIDNEVISAPPKELFELAALRAHVQSYFQRKDAGQPFAN